MSADLSIYKVSKNETTSSTKFDSLVDALQDALNSVGDTSKTAFAGGLIFDPAKIMQNGANSGDVLTWNGTQYAPAAPPAGPVVYRKTTAQDVTNTTTETDLLNGEITLAAGALDSNKIMRATLVGDLLFNRNASDLARIRVKLGGSTVYDSGATGGWQTGLSASRLPWRMDLWVQELGSTSSQMFSGTLAVGTMPATPSTGLGILYSTAGVYEFSSNGPTAVNATVTLALQVTVQWSFASTNNSFRLQSGFVEVTG